MTTVTLASLANRSRRLLRTAYDTLFWAQQNTWSWRSVEMAEARAAREERTSQTVRVVDTRPCTHGKKFLKPDGWCPKHF